MKDILNNVGRICNKCGAKQKPNKDKSDKNWTCYGNEKCKCGGEFKFSFIKPLFKERIGR